LMLMSMLMLYGTNELFRRWPRLIQTSASYDIVRALKAIHLLQSAPETHQCPDLLLRKTKVYISKVFIWVKNNIPSKWCRTLFTRDSNSMLTARTGEPSRTSAESPSLSNYHQCGKQRRCRVHRRVVLNLRAGEVE
jgi:hypothetical protein